MTLAKPASGTEVLANKTAAASGTTTLGDCTVVDSSNAIQVAAEVVATYNASATLGGRLEVFGSLDNTNWSTQPFAGYDMVFESAGATTRQVFGVANAPRYLRFRLRNLDTGQSITAIYVNVALQTVT